MRKDAGQRGEACAVGGGGGGDVVVVDEGSWQGVIWGTWDAGKPGRS